MSKFTSSYSRIMLSLLSPKIPEISNEYAVENEAHKTTAVLSAQQIQEAVNNPSPIMQQIFRVTSEIQKALNSRNAALEEITQKRDYIKLSLIKLQEMYGKAQEKKDDKASIQKSVKIKELIDILNKELADLQIPEQNIQAIRDELNQAYTKLNTITLEYKKKWHEHRELYLKQLEEELKNNGIALNDLEKNQLKQISNSATDIQQKLARLDSLKIDVKNPESDFGVIAYDAVVAALGRDLKPIDTKIVNSIIEKLPVIAKEKAAIDSIEAYNAKQCEQIIAEIHKLKTQESKTDQDLDKKDEILSDVDQKIQLIIGKK